MSIRTFYAMWPQYDRRLREVVRPMTEDQLAIRPSPEGWPIWATVGHTALMRVYWLCDVVGEPGADATPFGGGAEFGWEDDLDHPRTATELVNALESTWAIVDRCLERWSPATLEESVERMTDHGPEVHTRASILLRMLTHDAYHCGELSQTLGLAGLPQIDLWRPD